MRYDYIIVGAGTAGCVLAARLTEAPDVTVLLLEAGGPDRNPMIHMPAGLGQLVPGAEENWEFETEPEPNLCQRRLFWPRGRVLGGSSSINAMCYIRGQAEDYDGWAELGNEGWSFREVLPYFRLSEDQEHGEDEYHGVGGPLAVSDLRYRNPICESFVEAARAAGLPANRDFNGPSQEGVGFYQVNQRRGRRCSAATAFLHPAMARPNLIVGTEALVSRVRVESGRAVGVAYRRRGESREVTAEREVILAGGAVNSPQLLMLSGIGPADHLRQHDIAVATDLPGVGGNLQDHLDISVNFGAGVGGTYNYNPLQRAAVGLRWLLTHAGPGTTNTAEAGGFARSSEEVDRPDLQLHFVPANVEQHGRIKARHKGMTLHVCCLRPASLGEIRLRSADPGAHPAIRPRYLTAEPDETALVRGVRLAREIYAARPFAGVRTNELAPGSQFQTEEELRAAVRRRAETIYHPVGTCRMGTDEDAVVDPGLRVRGVEGLRVVDASIMPTLVSGNTNAPTVMIAEKAADLILGHKRV